MGFGLTKPVKRQAKEEQRITQTVLTQKHLNEYGNAFREFQGFTLTNFSQIWNTNLANTVSLLLKIVYSRATKYHIENYHTINTIINL